MMDLVVRALKTAIIYWYKGKHEHMKRETEYINKSHIGLIEIKNMIYKMKKYTGWTWQQIRCHRRNSREPVR